MKRMRNYRRLMFNARQMRQRVMLGGLACACLSLGCARLPPNRSAFSGKRLRVYMKFRQPVNPAFHYFFVINKAGTYGTSNAPGPVPVLSPANNGAFGNGFATGSDSSAHSFTDYVEFTQGQFFLYHVGVDTLHPFFNEGRPVSFSPFVQGTDTLSFDLDLGQLNYDTTNQPLNQTDSTTIALQIQYLQVNIIATDNTSQLPDVASKEIDALGNTLDTSAGQTNFLQLDVRTQRTYQNSDNTQSTEPSSNDVYVYPVGTGDPALDLIDWSIQIVQQ